VSTGFQRLFPRARRSATSCRISSRPSGVWSSDNNPGTGYTHLACDDLALARLVMRFGALEAERRSQLLARELSGK
jgi:hypothetical protein